MSKLMNISKTKQGRSVSGRGLPTVATSLLRCSRPGLIYLFTWGFTSLSTLYRSYHDG